MAPSGDWSCPVPVGLNLSRHDPGTSPSPLRAAPHRSRHRAGARPHPGGPGIKAAGDVDMAWRGTQAYLNSDATAVTNAAHAKGVRVVPTFQLFDSGSLAKMTAFLGSAAAQDRFVGQALDLMARRSADGA